MMVGPTAVPDRVLKAMNRKSISHRSKEYCEIHARVREGLKKVFGTKNEVFILTSSGTGAMEAAIQNCFSVGDEVVVPVLGTFSEQFALMAEAHQLKVIRVNFELGEAADVDMVPAGLSFISLSDKAWESTKSSNLPKYYFDLNKARKFQDINQTPNTPAVYNIFAVDEALKMIFEEGLDNVYKRHIENTERIIEGVRKLGYDIFPKDERYASRTLTAVYAPGKAKKIVEGLKDQGIIVNTGLAPIAEDVFRVGVMGYVYKEDVDVFLEAPKLN